MEEWNGGLAGEHVRRENANVHTQRQGWDEGMPQEAEHKTAAAGEGDRSREISSSTHKTEGRMGSGGGGGGAGVCGEG